ncbi:acyl-CoA synthetase [Nocardia nova]|uniref:fatty acyl-CoA synthetase n=1 Tax=Nocardia nova TaxID=37330 RepID=UPI000CE9AEE2|nr:fatty acyl-CoA synthetase [Nocardia nova]PPJ14419.1 acyl-CoA synthetase [Nocardia nova]
MTDDPTIRQARSHALGDIPRRSALRCPDKIALVHRDTSLTFAEFDRLVDRAAACFWDQGLRPGDRLVVMAHNCWQYPVVVFGAARIGVVTVPVNFMLTAAEVAYLLEDCRPAGVVAEDSLCHIVDEAAVSSGRGIPVKFGVPLGDSLSSEWNELDTALAGTTSTAPHIEIDDDALIRIMYTSGTESRPKGVMHSSRTLLWQYTSCIASGGKQDSDVEVHALPFYHCAQLDNFLVPDIYLGATSIILDRPDPVAILDAIEKFGITNLFCPPTVWISILRELSAGKHDPSTLRKGYYGASALPREVLSDLRAILPGIQLWNFYGQTEMGSLATVLQPCDQDSRGGSAGRAALNVATLIVDDEGRPLRPGEVGEIVHRSPQATLGYYNLEQQTREAFAHGWFHSGDLGYIDDDGYLWVVDRKKDMVKSGGENVASREVEEVLYEMPQINEAAVYGIPDSRWIEAVAATVVLGEGESLTAQEITRHCRERLAPYKVPKSIRFADELPKNPSGKVLKRVLREQHTTSE